MKNQAMGMVGGKIWRGLKKPCFESDRTQRHIREERLKRGREGPVDFGWTACNSTQKELILKRPTQLRSRTKTTEDLFLK